MTIIEGIIKEVEKFNDSIRDALDLKNISNTREASNSLRIDYGEDFVSSIGIFYLEFLDTGRGTGKMPPISPIKDWAKNKFGVDDKEALSIAFAVAHKIAVLGTEIFINNSKGIELEKKVLNLKENINANVGQYAVSEIKQVLDKYKKLYNLTLN